MSAKTAPELLAWVVELFWLIYALIKSGSRSPQEVGEVFQKIKEWPDFFARFFPKKVEDGLSRFSAEDWVYFYLAFFRDHVARLFKDDKQELRYAQLEEKLRAEFAVLKLPQREGFDWLVIVLRGLTPNDVYAAIKACMPAWRYRDDLNAGRHDRVAEQTYAVSFRATVEADEVHANKSAEMLAIERVVCITTLERLLLGFMYTIRTSGRHLDVGHWTLCAGSRDPGGDVPDVYLGGGGCVGVGGWFPWTSVGDLRTREAVLPA